MAIVLYKIFYNLSFSSMTGASSPVLVKQRSHVSGRSSRSVVSYDAHDENRDLYEYDDDAKDDG